MKKFDVYKSKMETWKYHLLYNGIVIKSLCKYMILGQVQIDKKIGNLQDLIIIIINLFKFKLIKR